MTLGSGILGGGILGGVISQPSPQSKKIEIKFYNPTDESNIDHLEVWWKLGAGGTYAQLGTDLPFVSGLNYYLVEDASANVVDGAILYYEARAYNASGDYSAIGNLIQVSGGASSLPSAPTQLSFLELSSPKRVQITFKNPVDEVNLDHLEVWVRVGEGGEYAQIGTDIPFVTGTADYVYVDDGVHVVDSASLHYSVRAYSAGGDWAEVTGVHNVSSPAGEAPTAVGTLNVIDSPVGTIYEYDTSVLFTGEEPKTYSLNGSLPDGIQLDSATGIIRGVTTLEGSFSGYSVTATNASGSDTTNTDTCAISARPVLSVFQRDHSDYQGYAEVSCSSITANITLYENTSQAPCFIQASAKNTTAVGTTHTGEALIPKTHAEFSWLLLDSSGNVPSESQIVRDPTTGLNVNLYTEQVRCNALFPISNLIPDTYTIVLVARMEDGVGGYTTDITKTTFTVTANNRDHLWYDGVNGDDANNGYDAWGLVYSGGTYVPGTGILSVAGGFTAFTPTVGSVDVLDSDSWLYIDSVCVPVRKIDNDSVEVVEGYRDQVIATTGLSSVAANGPIQSILNTAMLNDTVYHINGNGSRKNEVIRERFGLGNSTNKHFDVVGFNGDPLDNGRVKLVPNSSWSNLTYPVIVGGGFDRRFSLTNIRIDALGLSKTVDISRQGWQGVRDATDGGEVKTFNNVYLTGNINSGAGIYFHEPDDSVEPAALIFHNTVCNDVDAKGQLNKGNATLLKLAKATWFNATGCVFTGWGGAINNTFDHSIYVNGKSNNISLYLCDSYQTAGERRFGYSFNMNSGGSLLYSTPEPQVELDYTEIVSTRAENAGYFADFSGSNNSRENDSWFGNVRLQKCFAKIPDAFTYYNNCSNMTLIDNVQYQYGVRNQVDGFVISAGNIAQGIVDNDSVVWNHDNHIFASGNIIVENSLSSISNTYDGSSTFEFIENEVYETANNLNNIDKPQSDHYDASHSYLNNTIYSLNNVQVSDFDGFISLATLSSRVVASGGEFSGNVTNAPDWQDVANENFLTSAHSLSAPTILNQPSDYTSTVGGDALFVVNTERSDTLQWEVDTGGGYVDIEHGVNAVLKLSDLPANYFGASFRCKCTNGFGVTTSVTATCVV